MLATQPQGLRTSLWRAANAFSQSGRVPPQDLIRTTRKRFWHRVVYGTTGPTRIDFFDSAKSKFINNFANGNLQNNQFYFISSIRIDVQTNIAIATGAVQGSNAGSQALRGDSTAGGIPFTTVQNAITVLSTGLFTLTVGGAVISDVYGLQAFPAGGGVVAYPAFGTTNATSDGTFGVINNGLPASSNAYMIPKYPVTPGQEVRGTIEWQASHTIAAPMVIMLTLDGTLMEWIADPQGA